MIRSQQNNINTPPYWDSVYSEEISAPKVRVDLARLKCLERWVDVRRSELGRLPSLLDVGCGLGEIQAHFSNLYPEMILDGVDISSRAIEYCRGTRQSSRVNFQVALATKLPWPEGQFDMTWCGETLEHLEDPEAALKELARVTGTGGLVAISIPYRGRNRDKEHVWEFEPADLFRWGLMIGELLFMDCDLVPGRISMFGVLRRGEPS